MVIEQTATYSYPEVYRLMFIVWWLYCNMYVYIYIYIIWLCIYVYTYIVMDCIYKYNMYLVMDYIDYEIVKTNQ